MVIFEITPKSFVNCWPSSKRVTNVKRRLRRAVFCHLLAMVMLLTCDYPLEGYYTGHRPSIQRGDCKESDVNALEKCGLKQLDGINLTTAIMCNRHFIYMQFWFWCVFWFWVWIPREDGRSLSWTSSFLPRRAAVGAHQRCCGMPLGLDLFVF